MAFLVKPLLLAVCVAFAASLTTASTIPPSTTDSTATTSTTFQTSTTSTFQPSTTDSTTTTFQPSTTDSTTTTFQPSTTEEETTITTTAPQPPFNCYDCNSGLALEGYWQFENCPRNGNLTIQPVSCSTFCFSYVGMFPAGDVVRGCGAALWFPEGQEPQDGCFEDTDNNRHMCVCRGHTCNTHNLTDESTVYTESYLAWRAQQEATNAAAAAANSV